VAVFSSRQHHGQRVVEDRIVGGVAHGEVVDLCDRAGLGLILNIDALDAQLA
jgi:hypothetical protein